MFKQVRKFSRMGIMNGHLERVYCNNTIKLVNIISIPFFSAINEIIQVKTNFVFLYTNERTLPVVEGFSNDFIFFHK